MSKPQGAPACRPLGRGFGVFLLISLSTLAACSQGPPPNRPVDASRARETLQSALSAWKQGESTDALKERTPSIIVQDADWKGGAKLLEFELLEGAVSEGANLVARVRLKLADSQGVESEQTVTYVVGTDPVLTVFRDLFR